MCLVPGTAITLGDGSTCPVEDVRPGMTVRTGRGLERLVKALHRRPYDDDLVRITCRGGRARATLTERHAVAIPRPIVIDWGNSSADKHRHLILEGRRRRSTASARPAPSSAWLWRSCGDLLSSDLLIAPAAPRGLARVGRLERYPGRHREVFSLEIDSEQDLSHMAGGLLIACG